MDFLINHWLDITTTILGLAYILLEYKASIWMWAVGAVMQILGIVLYYQKGLYADCGMEFYYLAMTAYGFWCWSRKHQTSDIMFTSNIIRHTSYILTVEHDIAKVASEGAAAKVRTNLAEYLEKGIVK